MNYFDAYLAGFFDGEGCVGIYRSSSRGGFRLLVQITQNVSPSSIVLFQQVQQIWGGSISTSVSANGTEKLGYQVGSDKAVKFLSDLLPYLREKREQAEVAIEWQKNRPVTTRGLDGRIMKKNDDVLAYDLETSNRLKELKKGTK